jgi:hypothetical protein
MPGPHRPTRRIIIVIPHVPIKNGYPKSNLISGPVRQGLHLFLILSIIPSSRTAVSQGISFTEEVKLVKKRL